MTAIDVSAPAFGIAVVLLGAFLALAGLLPARR